MQVRKETRSYGCHSGKGKRRTPGEEGRERERESNRQTLGHVVYFTTSSLPNVINLLRLGDMIKTMAMEEGKRERERREW